MLELNNTGIKFFFNFLTLNGESVNISLERRFVFKNSFINNLNASKSGKKTLLKFFQLKNNKDFH